MQSKMFLSGNEAVAWGVKLARPQVIAAYPITPQTIVIERLSEMIANGKFNAEYLHVESEHSALGNDGSECYRCTDIYCHFITGAALHGRVPSLCKRWKIP